MNSSDNQVLTYDGHRARQRPRLVIFNGIEYSVIDCESLYISTGEHRNSPIKRGFHVRCKGGRQFKLELTEGLGWQIEQMPGPFTM